MIRSTAEESVLPRAVTRAAHVLESAGLSGALLVRHLGTGQELALNPDVPFPLASVAKLPLAAAALDAARRGEVDLAMQLTIDPRGRSDGGPGITRFSYPATVAVEDLIRLAVELSDNAAADAVFSLVPPAAVTSWLREMGVAGVVLRHPIEDLYRSLATQTSATDAATVHALVVAADHDGHASPLPELDVERANTGTARGLADLLQHLWGGSIHPTVAAKLRSMLAGNILRHRLAPDFSSDAAKWSSKTGSFVHLRHEAGVVEHANGETLAVVALTRSSVAATIQPAAEQAMGHAARILHDELLTAS